MALIGNICLAIALLIYVVPMQALLRSEPREVGGAAGFVVSSIFVMVPLWSLLTAALMLAVGRGGFDWMTRERALQFVVVLIAGIAMAVLSIFSLALRQESGSQIPWAMRPFIGWAALAFPPLVMAFCLCALNPSIGSAIPAFVYRTPMAAVGGVSLLAGLGLLAQCLAVAQRSRITQVNNIVATQDERDRKILAEIESMNTITDFGRLLSFTGLYETLAIRELALNKLKSRPDFSRELAARLRTKWCGEAVIFLEANDPPETASLAEPVREAILQMAARVRERMRTEHWLYDDSFDSDARRVMAVADKCRGHGVDYSPAIREFRNALDEPRGQKINPNCRLALDQWLERNASR